MEQSILLINACVREESRTLRLAERMVAAFQMERFEEHRCRVKNNHTSGRNSQRRKPILHQRFIIRHCTAHTAKTIDFPLLFRYDGKEHWIEHD